MARENALNIFINDNDKDKLAEIYGEVIEAIQTEAISEQIKNKNYSGDINAGSVEIDRFKNATVDDLGTARTSGEGKALKNTGKVTINVDTDKEIVEELAKKDVKLYGITGMAEKRKVNHKKRMIAYLDTEFFNCAVTEGTEITVSENTIEETIEALIQDVQTTVNDWVDGVDRDMLVLTLKPSVYGKLKNYIDNIDGSNGNEKLFHDVRVFSNHRQTADAICMIDGAIGQPVITDEYDAEKIPLSNDIALELFFSKGTKAVMADLIKYIDTVILNTVSTNVVITNTTTNPVNTKEVTVAG